jgi:hypothetical protein
MKTITTDNGFEYRSSRSKSSKVKVKKVESKIPSVSFSENLDKIVLVKGNLILTYDKSKKTLHKVSKVSAFYSKTGSEKFINLMDMENVSVLNKEDLLQYI